MGNLPDRTWVYRPLKVSWHVTPPNGSLRGKQRDGFTAWLFDAD